MILSKALADCAVKINKTMEDLLPGALGAEDILRDAMKYSSLNEGKKYDHLWCFSLPTCSV